MEGSTTSPAGDESRRRTAVLAVLPFLALGVADVTLLVLWGLDPVWAALIVPPVGFTCVLAWLAFATGFVDERS